MSTLKTCSTSRFNTQSGDRQELAYKRKQVCLKTHSLALRACLWVNFHLPLVLLPHDQGTAIERLGQLEDALAPARITRQVGHQFPR